MMLMLLRGVGITITVPEEIIEVTSFYKELILLGSPASLALFMREASIWLRLCIKFVEACWLIRGWEGPG